MKSQIHLVQLNIKWRNKQSNFNMVQELLEGLDIKNELIVLPEMFATGFDVEYGGLAEGQDGQLEETDGFLKELAIQTQCYVQGSGISYDPLHKKRQNIVRVFNPAGESILTYQKTYPFSFGGEHRRFSSGPGAAIFDFNGILVARIICYDLRFPELFREAIDLGAEMFTVVANWPTARQSHWKPLLQARAIENQAMVVGVNRCGRDEFLTYEGQSVGFDEYGREINSLGKKEGVLSMDVDIEKIRKWREEFPALNDRKNQIGDE